MSDDSAPNPEEKSDSLHVVTVRYPLSWWRRVQHAAVDAGMTASDFIRKASIREAAQYEARRDAEILRNAELRSQVPTRKS